MDRSQQPIRDASQSTMQALKYDMLLLENKQRQGGVKLLLLVKLILFQIAACPEVFYCCYTTICV